MKKFSKINESKQELFEDVCIEITDILRVDPKVSIDENDSYEFCSLKWIIKIYKGSSIEVNEESIKLIKALQEIPTIQKRMPTYKMAFKIEELYFQITFIKYKEPKKINRKYEFISGQEFSTIFVNAEELICWLADNGYEVKSMENERGDSGGEGCIIEWDSPMPNNERKELLTLFSKQSKELTESGEISSQVLIDISELGAQFHPEDRDGFVEFNKIFL